MTENPLKALMARKAAENAANAKAAQGVSVAEQRNIETGPAASVSGKFGTLRSYPTDNAKELDVKRAASALAVFEDIKLRHIQRGRGKLFRAEAGYFYVENEFDMEIISGYVGKSIPVIKEVPQEFIQEELAKLPAEEVKKEGE